MSGWGSQWGTNWGNPTRYRTKKVKRKIVLPQLDRVLNKNNQKMTLHFDSKTKGDSFDSYENNYTDSPVTQLSVKGYVRCLSPESLIFRKYGMYLQGSIEVNVDSKYKNRFLVADRIELNNNYYEVFVSATGAYSSVRDLPFGRTAIVLKRKSGENQTVRYSPENDSTFLHDIIRKNGIDITVYLPLKTKGDSYDPYEENYTYSNLPKRNITGYAVQAQSLRNILSEYGLKEQDSLLVLADINYKNYFELSSLIEIDGKKYQVFREGTGGNAVIQTLPKRLIRVVLKGV